MIRSISEDTGEYDGLSTLSEHERHRVLAAERRRTALDLLAGWAHPVDLEDLATAIAAREDDGDEIDEVNVERVAIDLHHVHLPQMAAAGLVDYDTDANRIESLLGRLDS